MKRSSKSVIRLVVLLLVVLFLGFPFFRYGYSFSDGLECIFTTGQHETQFSAGYSDRAFAQVLPGMTTNEVLHILGEPLNGSSWSKWSEGQWEYSMPASSSGHYHLRTIQFTKEGLVLKANKLFYFD